MAQAGMAIAGPSSSSTSGLPLYAPPRSMRLDAAHDARQPFDQQDPHVYFDQQAQTWRCEAPEDGDGAVTELEWNAQRRVWMPVFDEELFNAQQQAYGADEVDEGSDEEGNGIASTLTNKRKAGRGGRIGGTDAERPSKQPRKKQLNTNVYVTGLPLDATRDEIASVFSRYGVLYEDDAGEPRVKMYADRRTGMFKGEALVTYFKEESVSLAIQVLDESALRAAEGKSDPIMHVSRAEFGDKSKGNADKKRDNGNKEAEGGDLEIDQSQHNQSVAEARGQPSAAPQPSKPSAADRKKASKRFARMNGKLTDWNSDSDDDNVRAAAARSQSSAAAATSSKLRQVCLRKMFSLAELDEDPTLLLDLKEDVREECESLGKVTNVVLWDEEPEGIITVKFGDHAAAVACMQKMDGRFFGGRQVIAHLLEGKPRFRRSGKSDAYEDDDDDDEAKEEASNANGETSDATKQPKGEGKRRDAFGDWLEGGGDE